MSQFVQPASTRPLFIYGLVVLGQRREVKEGTGVGGIVGKKREKEKDLCQQMKEPSFACVSGEIKENLQRLCLTVNQVLLGVAVGSGGLGCRWGPEPGRTHPATGREVWK